MPYYTKDPKRDSNFDYHPRGLVGARLSFLKGVASYARDNVSDDQNAVSRGSLWDGVERQLDMARSLVRGLKVRGSEAGKSDLLSSSCCESFANRRDTPRSQS